VKIQQLLVVLVLATAVVLGATAAWKTLYPYGDNSANFPEGVFYICQDCGEQLVLTLKQLGEHHEKHYGQPVPCPKCESKKTVRAERCPHCGHMFPMTRLGGKGLDCPRCKKQIHPPSM